jgi:hypothetical protein
MINAKEKEKRIEECTKIGMEINEEKEMTIRDFFHLCEHHEGRYQIETPDGWKDINFLVKKKDRECYNLITQSGKDLECSISHQIISNGEWKETGDLNVDHDTILTKDGEELIVAKEYVGIKDTYDLQVDSDESRYYSNDIVSHNCGKSLVCKAISSNWHMPLLRLDFGRLFGSLVGDSEKNAREAIKLAEAVAPSILWIDEIEKAISGVSNNGRSDGGTTSRVLSTFLTWMQEKTSSVFVVATANDHSSIPPEFLRAGRFDEIFFVDLPNKQERIEIFEVLLRQRNLKSQDFSTELLADKSDHYSGAEIEKAIDNAMLVGFMDGKRKITTDDIAKALKEFKTLFEMRKSDFEELREWAETQCLKANEEYKDTANYRLGAQASLDL